MTRRAVFAAVVAFALAVSVTFAQKKPDFSGRWVTISPADAAGQEQSYKQDAATLTTSHGAEGPDHVFTYDLSGKETRRTMTSHGETITTLSTATWDGERLVITEKTTDADGRQLDQKQTLSLDQQGQLVIDLTATMTGRPTQTMTLVHKKK